MLMAQHTAQQLHSNMYYISPTNILYWYDSGAALDGLPEGSMPITNNRAREISGGELHGPSPYPSWILHESESYWVAPVPMPTDSPMYEWDEAGQTWILTQKI